MTPRTASPPPRPSLLHRYGPLSIVLVAVVLAGVLASTGENRGTGRARGDATVGSAEKEIAVSWLEATKTGDIGDLDWGDRCDTTRGRLEIPSVYAPPCAAARPGVEGGATYQGVTADSIKVVLYQAADDDLAASLQEKADPDDVVFEQRKLQVEMFEGLVETWGRKIEIVRLKGRGSSETDARADAVKVAEEIKAFASIGGPAQESAYAQELASRGVLCISCGLSMPDSFYQEHAPYVWGNLQTPEQYLPVLSEVTIDMLNGGKATFAGDPAMHDRTRVFGSVNFEQDPPQFGDVNKRVDAVSKARGFERKISLTYQLVIPELAEKARTIIGQLKGAGVTTVIFLGDPVMPIYLTAAATAQNYFPEWIITGTVLTDTTTLGRMYDQQQWANAFGISSLPTPVPREQGESWRLHEWYYGEPPVAQRGAALSYEPIRLFMYGVHLAGPKLTPETFRDGLFGYPPSGGDPIRPQISWGEHGYYEEPDYNAVDDMRLVWWDAEATGLDEQGEEGTGMLRSAYGGKRFLMGQMPRTTDWIQNPDDAPARFEDLAAVGVDVPDYPPPTRAGG